MTFVSSGVQIRLCLENLMEVNVEALNVFKHSQGKKGLLRRKNVKCQCLYNERCVACIFCLLTFTWEESVTSIKIKIRRGKWGIKGVSPKAEKVRWKKERFYMFLVLYKTLCLDCSEKWTQYMYCAISWMDSLTQLCPFPSYRVFMNSIHLGKQLTLAVNKWE